MRRTYTAKEKLAIVKEYLDTEITFRELALRHGYKGRAKSFENWVHQYKMYGESYFYKGKYHTYPDELKEMVINEYNDGAALKELSIKYEIDKRTIEHWTSNKNQITKLIRDLTEGQRIKIAKYCILHDCNYTKTAEKCGLTSAQVRRITLRYMRDYNVTSKEQIVC